MSENPYEASKGVSLASGKSLAVVLLSIACGVFACLWLKAEYQIHDYRRGNERKDQAVIEWTNRDPEFRKFLSERLSPLD